MSPSSSTFSSEAARYLGVAALTVVLLVAGVAGISLIGIDRGLVTWKEAQLLRYQLDKIAAARRGRRPPSRRQHARQRGRRAGLEPRLRPRGPVPAADRRLRLRRHVEHAAPGAPASPAAARRGASIARDDATAHRLRRSHVHGRDARRHSRHPALAIAGPARDLGHSAQHAGQRAHAARTGPGPDRAATTCRSRRTPPRPGRTSLRDANVSGARDGPSREGRLPP